MNLIDDLRLATRFLRFRLVSTLLTIFSVAAGVALILWLQGISSGVRSAFLKHATPYNLVVGAVGSPIQLMLSSVFYLDRPVGNISGEIYQQLKSDPAIERAVPLAIGDSFRGFPVVGTTDEFFRPVPGSAVELRVGEGRGFTQDFEAVMGSDAAKTAAIRVGDEFVTSHGFSGHESHTKKFAVVGILEPTGGPQDRAVFCSVESIRKNHSEDSAAGATGGEVTAVLVRPRDLTYLPLLMRRLNLAGGAQAVFPAAVLQRLFDVFDIWKKVLELVCWVVVAVALTSVSITLYSFVEERTSEIALMRALGASRARVTRFVLLQSELLALGGGVAGVVLGHLLMLAFGEAARTFTGIEISWTAFGGWECAIFGALAVTGALFGWLPARRAYRVSIGDHLD